MLTVQKLKPIARTLQEVADGPVLRVIVEKNTHFSDMFLVYLALKYSLAKAKYGRNGRISEPALYTTG